MLDQFLAELWSDRHEARFEELRVADDDDLLGVGWNRGADRASNDADGLDRDRVRPAVGEGFSGPTLSIAGRVHSLTMTYVSRRPPKIPDSQISRVRFQTLACPPCAFPWLGEV